MWPFDNILLKRIKDLESLNETLIGKNEILERELDMNRNERSELLEKIFNLTGVNKVRNVEETKPVRTDLLHFGRKTTSWPALKESLEVQAKKDYWEKKNKDKEVQAAGELNELEKDILEK